MPRKKIAYISGSRADFGPVIPVLKAIEKSDALSLQVYATGMHLMPKFGETIREVEKIFPSVQRIEAVFTDDSRESAARFAGALLQNAVAALTKDRPDLVLLLGDRVEMLTVATACLYLGIPTAHLHGGEKTATVDEVARHAISKMASLHFTTTRDSAERLKKMGEEAWRIHIVGAPALDTILHTNLPARRPRDFILVVQHSVSGEEAQAGRQMEETLAAVASFNLPVAVIYPNADPGSARIIEVIEKERKNPLFSIFKNLPHADFLALERDAAVWVGNSSGALIESASFRTPVVNVGTRQNGRVRSENVIDVGYDRAEIVAAIHRSLHDKTYRARLKTIQNPWGDGRTGERVVKILGDTVLGRKLLAKQITY